MTPLDTLLKEIWIKNPRVIIEYSTLHDNELYIVVDHNIPKPEINSRHYYTSLDEAIRYAWKYYYDPFGLKKESIDAI